MNQFPLLFVLQRSEMAIFWPTSIGKEKREEGREEGEGQYFILAFFPPPFKVARWQNLIPPPTLHPGTIQGKEGIKFCTLA